MTQQRITWKDIATLGCAVIGAFAIVAGSLRADGGRSEELLSIKARIVRLESADERRGDGLNQINDRLARIETKLEMLAPRGAGR